MGPYQIVIDRRGNASFLGPSKGPVVNAEHSTLPVGGPRPPGGGTPPLRGRTSYTKPPAGRAKSVMKARHAMRESAVKKLVIRTGSEDEKSFIAVEDTGCGIPKKDVRRVFEPFFTTKGALGGGEMKAERKRCVRIGAMRGFFKNCSRGGARNPLSASRCVLVSLQERSTVAVEAGPW